MNADGFRFSPAGPVLVQPVGVVHIELEFAVGPAAFFFVVVLAVIEFAPEPRAAVSLAVVEFRGAVRGGAETQKGGGFAVALTEAGA